MNDNSQSLFENPNVKKEIEVLRQKIRHHNFLYYVQNSPEINDEQYDSLFDRLERLESDNPQYITSDSPTQRVGAKPKKGFSSYKHRIPMLSLSKVNTQKGVESWYKRITGILTKDEISISELSFYSEVKLDGLALELIYENGILTKASTRGDGLTGEDVTENVRTIKSIPLKLHTNSPPTIIEIRGEVIFRKKDFQRLNENRKLQGMETFANARNAAAGTLRQLDPSITAQRPLSAYFYDIGTFDDKEILEHGKQIDFIKSLGLPCVPQHKETPTLDDIDNYFQYISKIRDTLDYEIDGVVVKVNKLSLQKILGEIARSPRWAIALKFPSESAITKLNDVLWNVGRSGAIIPVAILEAVEIGGVTVKRASLHNEDFINDKDIRIGDTLSVKRAGDVIPYVVQSHEDLRNDKEIIIIPPTTCPSCNTELVKSLGDAFRHCPNSNGCPAQIKEGLTHFVSKQAMDIDGLGEKQIEQFFENKLIQKASDLFKLTIEDLLPLERMGEKSAKNIITAIGKSKKASLDRLINALGIPGIGEQNAYLLAKSFGSLEKLQEADSETLTNIDSIGPVLVDNIFDYFQNSENQDMLKELQLQGINPIFEIEDSPKPLLNMKIVVTGTLQNFKRDEIKKTIKKLGGSVVSSVSKKTDFVLVGENPGSKAEKAEKLKIKIISELDFQDLIQLK